MWPERFNSWVTTGPCDLETIADEPVEILDGITLFLSGKLRRMGIESISDLAKAEIADLVEQTQSSRFNLLGTRAKEIIWAVSHGKDKTPRKKITIGVSGLSQSGKSSLIESLVSGEQTLAIEPTEELTITELPLFGETTLQILEIPQNIVPLPEGTHIDGYFHLVDVWKQSEVIRSADHCHNVTSSAPAPIFMLLSKFDHENPAFNTIERMLRLRLEKWDLNILKFIKSTAFKFEDIIFPLTTLIRMNIKLPQEVMNDILLQDDYKHSLLLFTEWGLPLLEKKANLTNVHRATAVKYAIKKLRKTPGELITERIGMDPPLWCGIVPLDVPEETPLHLMTVRAEEPDEEMIDNLGVDVGERLESWIPSMFPEEG